MAFIKLVIATVAILSLLVLSPIFLSIYLLGKIYIGVLSILVSWVINEEVDEENLYEH